MSPARFSDSFRLSLGYWMLESLIWVISLLLASRSGMAADSSSWPKLASSNKPPTKVLSPQTAMRRSMTAAPGSVGRDTHLQLEGEAARRKMQAAYSRLPLSFEPNTGQVRNAAKFLSHSSNHTLYLESHQVVFEWPTGRTFLPNRNEPRSVVKKAAEA